MQYTNTPIEQLVLSACAEINVTDVQVINTNLYTSTLTCTDEAGDARVIQVRDIDGEYFSVNDTYSDGECYYSKASTPADLESTLQCLLIV